MLEYEFDHLSALDEKKIQNYTGCLLPCQYKEYQVVDDPVTMGMTKSSIWLSLATSTVIVKTEELLYPFSSFLAEFGGALKLFLGFSFMTAWDVLQLAFNFVMSKKRVCKVI